MAVYGDMLAFFTDQFRSVSYFSMKQEVGAGYKDRTDLGKVKKSGRPVAVPCTDADRSVRKRSGGALGVYRRNRRYPETGVGKEKSDFGILDILFAFGKNLYDLCIE